MTTMEPLHRIKSGRIHLWIFPTCYNGKPDYRTETFRWVKPGKRCSWRKVHGDWNRSDYVDLKQVVEESCDERQLLLPEQRQLELPVASP